MPEKDDSKPIELCEVGKTLSDKLNQVIIDDDGVETELSYHLEDCDECCLLRVVQREIDVQDIEMGRKKEKVVKDINGEDTIIATDS